jgi:hypothetical protein
MKRSTNMPKRPIKRFIWPCPICKKETYHRCIHMDLVACNDCDTVQHKPLKTLIEASETKDPCECPSCHQDLSSCICGEATQK